jgi:CheY-like chemotaxis protein
MATVLVVDDDTVTRVLLRHVLERAGHSVIEAVDGHDALDLLDSLTADVVISDQEMPNLSGLELRSRLGPGFTTPFVLLTGYATRDEFSASDLLRIDAYLTKPVSSAAINELMTSLGF